MRPPPPGTFKLTQTLLDEGKVKLLADLILAILQCTGGCRIVDMLCWMLLAVVGCCWMLLDVVG